MLENIWLYLGILGVIIIFALAYYAGKLLMQVKQQAKQRQENQAKLQAQLYANDVKLYDSVIIIARAMKEEQCDISEGCWRISVLLDSLQTVSALDQKFTAIFDLYKGIKHLSIHEDRKSLPKQQRMKQDIERMKLEAEYSDQIINELDSLLAYARKQQQILIPIGIN